MIVDSNVIRSLKRPNKSVFELSVLKNYLIPRKKHLSRALIGLMSIGVISSVVWLTVAFLSVTKSIETTWLHKLTSLHAPIRIIPTPAYYSSYYYLIDTISQQSGYQSKTIHEKYLAKQTDPYDSQNDESIPVFWQKFDKNLDGTLKDPVKSLYKVLTDIQSQNPDLSFQDFESSYGMLRLKLVRPSIGGEVSTFFLTQASYLTSFSDQSSFLKNLILPPSLKDIQNLFLIAQQEKPLSQKIYTGLPEKVKQLLSEFKIHKVQLYTENKCVPYHLLPENTLISATALYQDQDIIRISLTGQPGEKGILARKGSQLFWNQKELLTIPPLCIEKDLFLDANLIESSLIYAKNLRDVRFEVQGALGDKQKLFLKGELTWDDIKIADFTQQSANWISQIMTQNSSFLGSDSVNPIILAKSFYNSGVKIGDRGWIDYPAAVLGSIQEQRAPIIVAGFYDPGVVSIGSRYILASPKLIHTMLNGQVGQPDKLETNGVSVWIKDLNKTLETAKTLKKQLEKSGVSRYWKVSTYHDYEFAQDILHHFQTETLLFTLISLIILIVGCSNVISFLIILVNDKKKEIGILQSLGATKASIAYIFGGAGFFLGLLSSLLGILTAFLTIKYLNKILWFISCLQGQGSSYPLFIDPSTSYQLSPKALLFVIVVTPCLSLVAGLIPAWKACRMSTSEILRSE